MRKSLLRHGLQSQQLPRKPRARLLHHQRRRPLLQSPAQKVWLMERMPSELWHSLSRLLAPALPGGFSCFLCIHRALHPGNMLSLMSRLLLRCGCRCEQPWTGLSRGCL